MTQPPPPPPPPWGGQPPGTPEWGNPQWTAANWGPPPTPPQGPTGGSERTGPLPLYPMALGDILDGAIKLYRANWKTVSLIALVFAGPLQVLAAVLQRNVNGGYGIFEIANDPSLVEDSSPTAQIIAPLVAGLGLLLVQPLIAGAVSKAVAASYLGTQITMGQAVRAAFRRFPALLAASLLIFGTYIVGLLACCIGLVFVYPLWVATSPSIVVEELGPIQGMRRSWGLTTRRYWPVLGTVILAMLLVQVLGGIVSGVPTFVALAIGTEWGFILIAIGSIASSLITEPFSAIVFTLIYFDLRIRNEGFDLDLMSRDWLAGVSPSLAELPIPNEPADRVRERADDILSRAEFKPPSQPIWQRALDWFGERIDDLFSAAGGGNPVVAWIIVAVIAVAVAFVVIRSIRALQRDPDTGGIAVEGARRPPADWRADAARHEAAGDWRAAVRAHFRALVAELAARGLVNEVPGRTTGEYRVEVSDSVPSASSAFSSASRLFEDAWYARVDISADDNSRAKTLSSAVLAEAAR